MRADRYVVGYAEGDAVYGKDDGGLLAYALPLSSRKSAEKRRARLSPNAVIYRLVPVRRVKAQRGKR